MMFNFRKLILTTGFLFLSQSALANDECADLISNKQYYKALDVCKKMAKKGEPASQFNLGTLYYQGLGVMADNKIAYKWINKSAQNNFAKAQYNIGIMIANGIGSEADLGTAYGWLILAKNNDYQEASIAIEQMKDELSKKEKQQANKFVAEFMQKSQLPEDN
ncbi:MAG: tetratricopeptide repeat protein [Pseudomonadota bacterium]